MNKVTFLLKRPSSNTPQAVFAQFRTGGGRLKIYTGLTVHPRHWDKRPSKQRVKPSVTNAAVYNALLDSIEADLKSIVAELMKARIEPTPELVKSRFEAMIQRDASRSGDKSLPDFFDEWIEQSRNTKTEQTLKLYQSVGKRLKEYADDRGALLTFDRMDREFVNSFTDYLIRIKNMQNSTVWHNVKTWKAFMRWAVDRGLTSNREYERITKKDFNVHPPVPVRLSEEELSRLAQIDLASLPYLENARNLFLLQCCLGVRVSDLLKIVANLASYRDGKFIRITTQKNRKAVVIPLTPMARKILDDRENLHPISDIKLNKYIKEVARRAGLDRLITQAEYRGMERKDRTMPLHEDISSHCAKRTFVSLMAAKGVSRAVIKAITGNTDATLDRYLKLDEAEISREMEKAADLLT